MSSNSNSVTSPFAGKSQVAWLAICLAVGLLLAPVFYGMPARMKFLGLHTWALAVAVGVACAWSGVCYQVQSRRAISCVSVLMAIVVMLLQAHWGYAELKQATRERMPVIPLPPQVGTPEELKHSLQLQQKLDEAVVPSFTDFQRRRWNAFPFRRIRPVALWSGEMLIGVVIAWLASASTYQQMTKLKLSDSLPSSPTAS